jgi:uncharacterized phage protein (TIGR02218 family)
MNASAFQAHLATCATTVCRAWAVTRRDGVVLGFTDHDAALAFEGITFLASSGMTARAVEQTTGLSVDNSEAVGMLSDPAIREADIKAGRFDGAAVRAWSVNWANVEERRLVFRGSLGEIERAGQAFRAELRGLAEALNQPSGRVYQRHCGAVLGDAACGVDLTDPAYWVEADVISIERGTGFRLANTSGHSDGWFTRGPIEVLTGASAGDVGLIKRDRQVAEVRVIETWDVLSAGLAAGDRVRLVAGCDKRGETCKVKFSNYNQFQGFPDLPGEDWLVSYPTRSGGNTGGSLR